MLKKWFLILISAAILSACVSNNALLTRADGKQYNCSAQGFGVIGSLVASSNFESCKQRAIAAGYKEN